jgi:hypothetical protein
MIRKAVLVNEIIGTLVFVQLRNQEAERANTLAKYGHVWRRNRCQRYGCNSQHADEAQTRKARLNIVEARNSVSLFLCSRMSRAGSCHERICCNSSRNPFSPKYQMMSTQPASIAPV